MKRYIILALTLALASNGGIMRVQRRASASSSPSRVAANHCTGDSTCNITLAVPSGNLIAVAVFENSGSAPGFSVADTVNAYANACGVVTQPDSGRQAELFYVVSAGAVTTITVQRTSVDGSMWAVAAHYSGAAVSSVLDQCNTHNNAGVTPHSGGVTAATTHAADVVVGAFITNVPYTAGTGFVIAASEFSGGAILEDMVVSSLGAQEAIATPSVASYGAGITAVFKGQ